MITITSKISISVKPALRFDLTTSFNRIKLSSTLLDRTPRAPGGFNFLLPPQLLCAKQLIQINPHVRQRLPIQLPASTNDRFLKKHSIRRVPINLNDFFRLQSQPTLFHAS